MMFFEDGSPIKDIRKALRQQEDEKVVSRPAAAQQADGADDAEGAETPSTFARRGVERRAPSASRTSR